MGEVAQGPTEEITAGSGRLINTKGRVGRRSGDSSLWHALPPRDGVAAEGVTQRDDQPIAERLRIA